MTIGRDEATVELGLQENFEDLPQPFGLWTRQSIALNMYVQDVSEFLREKNSTSKTLTERHSTVAV